mgnify:CR=1 FL=1
MVLMCGIDANGTITGATCLSSGETLGEEKIYGDSLKGKTANDIDTVEAISGATKTTAGYKNAVKDALNATIILGGGTVDIRSEEEILNDNLSEALPAAEGKFVSWFMAEALEKIDLNSPKTHFLFVLIFCIFRIHIYTYIAILRFLWYNNCRIL